MAFIMFLSEVYFIVMVYHQYVFLGDYKKKNANSFLHSVL